MVDVSRMGRWLERGRVAGALAAALAVVAGCGNTKPVVSGAGCVPADTEVSCSVLFIGNSYTAANDLPGVFAQMAGSANLSVKVSVRTAGGATLADHVAAGETSELLDDHQLNVVVLQEQSQIPASPELVASDVLPAATRLAAHARRVGAAPLLLQTWARRDGWPENGISTYAQMQTAVSDGYAEVASAVKADVAPVGEAWAETLSSDVHPPLWEPDGSHPTIAGTYLAACVLYAAIFGRSPQGIAYRDGVSVREAAQLQAIAWRISRPALSARGVDAADGPRQP